VVTLCYYLEIRLTNQDPCLRKILWNKCKFTRYLKMHAGGCKTILYYQFSEHLMLRIMLFCAGGLSPSPTEKYAATWSHARTQPTSIQLLTGL
jgi:hypothetical protein